MKISRRSVLRYSGLTAALLALTGCSASPGSAILGGDLPDWMKSLFCGSAASSSASSVSSSASSASSHKLKKSNAYVVDRRDRGTIAAVLISPNNIISTKTISE